MKKISFVFLPLLSSLSRLFLQLTLFLLLCTGFLPAGALLPGAEGAEEIKSSKGGFVLKVVPERPFRGETVTITAAIPDFNPARQGVYWDWRGEAEGIRSLSEREVCWEAREGSTTISATLWNRVGGETVDNASVTVIPQRYTVTLRTVPSSGDEKIKIWDDESKRLKELQGLATESPISLEAVLSPSRDTKNLRWVWSPGEGVTLTSQKDNRVSVYRETTGVGVLSVRILDEKGIELGDARTSFDVQFSAEDLKRSLRLQKGWEQWQKALALAQKRDEAENALRLARLASEELILAGMDESALRKDLDRLSQARDNYLNALALGSSAAALWRDGRPEDALMQYRQAQALYPDSRTAQSIEDLEGILNRTKKARESAAALAKEADALAEKDEFESALKKYEESLLLFSDPLVHAARMDVEGRFRARRRKMEEAKTVRDIALILESQGDLENALSKMTESREIYSLPETGDDLERIRSALQLQQSRRNEAERLTAEAAELEARGLENQGNVQLLEQALEKYSQAAGLWSNAVSQRSRERVKTHIAAIQAQISQVAALVKEAERLEVEGRLEEAMNRYHRAQNVRRESDTQTRMTQLARRIETRNKHRTEAKILAEQAREAEKQGRLDEALALARRSESIFPGKENFSLIQRLEQTIKTRNEKIGRAAGLAGEARKAEAEGNLEKALDLFIESESVWIDDNVLRSIQVLRGRVSEDAITLARAGELYREAVILERESRLELAEEKLTASLALASSDESAQLLSKVQKSRIEAAWLAALQANPPVLRAVPSLPRRGQRTLIRVDNGNIEDAEFRWKVQGNIRDGNPGSEGKTYSFYPANDLPVTVELSVLRKGTDTVSLQRTLSLTAEDWSVSLTANEGRKNALLWNANQKRLEEVHEFVTETPIEVQASLSPLPDGAVSWLWTVDSDSSILASGDNAALVRRVLPGTAKLTAVAKDARGIVLGEGKLSIPIIVNKSDVTRDARRALAWETWLKALDLWKEDRHLKALETAVQASVLDPGDPDVTFGVKQMKEDFEKMELSARLLSESTWLLSTGEYEEAESRAQEAEALRPGAITTEMKLALKEAEEKVRASANLAARLRAEGGALLEQGRKIEALLRLQDSLLLEKNDMTSKDVARLNREILEEKTTLAKAGDLRAKADALIDKKRYSDALKLYEQSRKLFPDPQLTAYMALIMERSEEEKVVKERADALRREGDSLLKNKKTSEALEKYRESLLLRGDEELEKILQQETKRFAQSEGARLRKDAEALIKKKRPADATEKYRESLKYDYDEKADIYVRNADATAAQALTKEGDNLLKQKRPKDALERYRRALQKTPDDVDLSEKIKKLEATLSPPVSALPASNVVIPSESASDDLSEDVYPKKAEEKTSTEVSSIDLVQADALFRDGNTLYREKKYAEALDKYRESYKLSHNPQVRDFADHLEVALKNMEKANKLVHEANDLYRNRKYADALNRYTESLKYHKNPEVEAFIPKLEAQIKK
ncbi:MAG: tetratricopeptide repeat protein [Synergistaceae bacterium]|jgi:tetratricopeptide (TPR) repeat protein|nr:tetratricopeptide repeat protein [Synergistaceae bacterium]